MMYAKPLYMIGLSSVVDCILVARTDQSGYPSSDDTRMRVFLAVKGGSWFC